MFFSSTPATPSVRTTLALALSRKHRAGQHAKQSAFTAGTLLAGCGLALALTAGALTFGVSSGGAASASASVATKAHVHSNITSGAGTDGASTSVAVAKAPTPVNDGKPIVTAVPSAASGPVTGGTAVTITGANLSKVTSVTVGGQPVAVTATADAITFTAPVSPDYAQRQAPIALLDASGKPVQMTAAVTAAVGGASLSFTYAVDQAAVANQVNYVLSYWSSYNPDYIQLDGVDCANFTSQALLARGWTMDGDWWYNAGATSPSWISSTALRDYMAAHPDRATSLGSARDQVKVGDVAQFDWDDSGDPDHTATVTRVDHTADGIKVYVGGHTKDIDFWDVDEALATGGGSVTFWSVH